ncbi:MAG: hypothetical protein NVS3B20_20600 [Polyangiales bacterium]
MTSLVVTPVQSSDLPALEALFDRTGCSCFCRYWHFTGSNKEWEARCGLEASRNLAEFAEALHQGSDEARGLVARAGMAADDREAKSQRDDRILGWMKLAPRRSLTKLLTRVPYRGMSTASHQEASNALSIGCFLIDPAERRSGIATALVRGALALGAAWGASFIEAYPRVGEGLHDGEMWTGPMSVFAALGFEVVRDAPQYPVLRCRVMRG